MDKRRKEINSNLELKLTPSPLKKGKKEKHRWADERKEEKACDSSSRVE